jgi:hypothetical protein
MEVELEAPREHHDPGIPVSSSVAVLSRSSKND